MNVDGFDPGDREPRRLDLGFEGGYILALPDLAGLCPVERRYYPGDSGYLPYL